MIDLDSDKVYYLASPYSSLFPELVLERYQEQGRLCVYLLTELGLCVINPIEMCHHLSQRFKLPSGYEYWKKRDRRLIDCCDATIVCMMNGWENSIGVNDEIAYTLGSGKIVYYLHPDTLEIIEPFTRRGKRKWIETKISGRPTD